MSFSRGRELFASSGAQLSSAADSGDLMGVLIGAGALVAGFIVLVAVVKRFLFICGPHEILVFSGGRYKLSDGSTSNYNIIQGGRGFRLPFLQVVRRMDMRLFPVEVVVQNAYSSGGIPLTVRAIANVKLASDKIAVRNAVERFLDYHPSQIAVAAQQTLEGVLREVISQLTPEEVNEDRLKFAESLMENARDDFDKLGLELDVLKVQHVSDEQDYLNNLGRARIARMLRDAENAENAANQAVAEAEAAAREAAQTASKIAETDVIEARNNAAGEVARLDAEAMQASNQASMAVETARARAEQQLQQLRAELEEARLHNDVVLPAQAERRAQELRAVGEAAPALENGRAAAEALRMVSEQWAAAGDAGKEVYVLQQLQQLALAAAERVASSQVGTIKLVGSDDDAYGAVLASHPAAVGRVLRETAQAMGIDIDKLLNGSGGAVADSTSPRGSGGSSRGGRRALPAGTTPNRLSAGSTASSRSTREGSI